MRMRNGMSGKLWPAGRSTEKVSNRLTAVTVHGQELCKNSTQLYTVHNNGNSLQHHDMARSAAMILVAM